MINEFGLSGTTFNMQQKITIKIVIELNPYSILQRMSYERPHFVIITPKPYAKTIPNTTNNCANTPKVSTIYFGDS
jgi:hypothetical protein